MSSLFEVKLQCCDADSYRQFGSDCAVDGVCHGALRPAGDYLWFSIPYRLGLPDATFVAANFLVIALGIFLSYLALKKIAAEVYGRPLKKWSAFFLLVISAGIHAVFLAPTVFHTLSDPPASMMFLSGIWLLILAHTASQGWVKAILYLLCGTCLGFGAWLRAFNLYPVIACVALYLLLWLFSKEKAFKELLILVALVPIGMQYAIMYKSYGTLSYLSENETKEWSNLHLNQSYVGFDTIFPRNGQYWPSKYCNTTLGILNGLQERDFKAVACVIAERLYFYLGSYEPETYIFSNVKNQLVGLSSENIGDIKSDWFSQKLLWEADVELAPNGQKTADRLKIIEVSPDGAGDVVQWVALRGNTVHTFSVWLWAPKPKTINLAFMYHWGGAPIAVRQFNLTRTPTRYSITGMTRNAGLYDIDIGRALTTNDSISFGTEEGDYFYAWGAQLEVSEKMTDYDANEKVDPNSVRIWHPWLLVVNLLMLVVTFCALFKRRSFWFGNRVGASILGALLVVVAESIAIIPEQRFVISLMIFLWLITGLFILMLCQRQKHTF